MGKNMWIWFGMAAIIIITIVLVALLIFIPQSGPIVDTTTEGYKNISKLDYTYTPTKDISEEGEIELFTITPEDVKEGKAAKSYKAGNTDPFAAQSSGNASGGNTNSGNNTNGSNTGSENNNTSGGTKNPQYSVDDK